MNQLLMKYVCLSNICYILFSKLLVLFDWIQLENVLEPINIFVLIYSYTKIVFPYQIKTQYEQNISKE